MAMTNNSEESSTIFTDSPKLAKYGIDLLINNQAKEAEELFRTNSESIQMSAGYAFVLFMDAIMSFEDDKLETALNSLRETEKKCAADMGWLKSVRNRVLGTKTTSLSDRLETQIILADTQVCVAILTFLQQEFSGYLKGVWIMRKAWKIYHQTYLEIVDLYKQKFGDFNLPDPTDFEWKDISTDSKSPKNKCRNSDGSDEEWSVPDSNATSPSPQPETNRNGYVPISSPLHKPNIPHSQSYIFSKTSNYFPFFIKRSDSAHSSLTNNANTENNRYGFSLLTPFSSHFSFLTSSLTLLTTSDNPSNEIDEESTARLMGAVCFGYGVLQLGMSLLPPSLLKVSNLFGFHGNRTSGISNLMYSRKGADMRAPLAMLALLWYHTIVRPFYALDGTNVKAGVEAATLLIQEAQVEYEQSALFLFFKGRIHRLDSNIPLALESYQAATNNSPQREIKLLALHEVGWCYLIQLDFIQSQKVFLKLKISSRWSKTFYSYLSIICSGSFGKKDFNEIQELRNIYQTTRKTNQLEIYIQRRVKIFPISVESLEETNDVYWKLYVYELIYLWNALPSCSYPCLDNIIQDCNETKCEPIPGLAKLIQGECFNIIGSYENAVDCFRQCVAIRSKAIAKDDLYVSAYGEYTLGSLLLKNPETKQEGITILQHCSNYKDYDFDNKLLVRINMALKNVS